MPKAVEKVTAFITRKLEDKHYLLLFEHPGAGIQIPAGTVESNETPEAAVVREVTEEAGLRSLFTDNHHSALFWAPLSALPGIIHPQNEWLEFLPEPFRPSMLK